MNYEQESIDDEVNDVEEQEQGENEAEEYECARCEFTSTDDSDFGDFNGERLCNHYGNDCYKAAQVTGDGSPNDIGERILNGVKSNDEEYGTDWPFRINLDSLDMDNGDACIRGQLAGSFHRSYRESGKSHEENMRHAKLHGFLEDEETSEYNIKNRELDIAWQAVIRVLRLERKQ